MGLKVHLLTFILLFFGILLYSQETIYDLLPDDDCQAIEVSGKPELYVGDDLFSLINGGAELYHEYGFVEVLAFDIRKQGAYLVKAEIYDMGSSDAAWGIFSMTATRNAETVEIGDAARKGEGFLQFIKGRYMIYIYYDSVEETDLYNAAGCIADNIAFSSDPPEITDFVNDVEKKAGKLIYFRGNLGLSSIYNFYYKDVFAYTEGTAAIYPEMKAFLLSYEDEVLCLEGYNSAKDFFLNSTKYHDQTSVPGSFHMKDKKERQVDCYFENTFLVIFVYSGEKDINGMREAIVDGMAVK